METENPPTFPTKPVPVAPVTPTPVIQPIETKKPPILMIVLIVLLVLSLAGIAYLAFQNTVLQGQLAQMKQITTVTRAPIPTQTPNLSSSINGGTYTNSALGFSFDLPTGYKLISQSSDKLTFGTQSTPSDPSLITYLIIYPTYRQDYSTLPECTETGPSQFPCQATETVAQSKVDIKVGDKDAKSYYINKGTVDSSYRIVQVANLELEMNISGGGLDNTFNQILSTFKFTN